MSNMTLRPLSPFTLNQTHQLYLKLFLVMCFWGSAFVSGRMLAQNHPPLVIAFLRFFIAIIFLFPVHYQKNKKIFPHKKSNYLNFALLGLFGVCLYNYFFLTGLKYVEAGRASIIIALNPVLSAIFSFIIFKEELKKLQIFGVLMGLLGTFIVLTRGNLLQIFTTGIETNELLLVLAVLSWIIYTLLGKFYLRSVSSYEAITWACFFGLIYLFPLAYQANLIDSIKRLSFIDIFNLLNLGLFSTVLGFIWYYEGVAKLGISKTTSFLNFLPLIGVLSGVIFLNETITLPLFIGGSVTIIGVFFVNKKN